MFSAVLKRLKQFKISFNQHGFSLIETAIVIPTVLLFTVGAVDVANYLRSYNAAKEAATAGIRCLYPTDGDCTSVTPATTIPQNNLYIPPFFSNHYDYDGQEKRLLLPNYFYGALNATVLDRVNYQADRRNWRADKPWYQGEGTATTLTLNIPLIGPIDPIHPINPRRAILIGGERVNGGIARGSLGEYRNCSSLQAAGQNGLGSDYGRVEFDLPALSSVMPEVFPGTNELPCNVVQRGALNERKLKCVPSDVGLAKIYFKLNGIASNRLLNNSSTSTRAAAHLNLRISSSMDGGISWNGLKRIGGQGFSTEDSANFYPRGFTVEEGIFNLNDSAGLRRTHEYQNLHGNITAPWGSKVRVELFISSPTGTDESNVPFTCPSNQKIKWEFSDIDVRVAKPRIVTVPNVQCANGLVQSQCNAAECNTNGNINFPGVGVLTSADYKNLNPRCGAQQGIVRSATASCTTYSNVPTQLDQDADYRINKVDYLAPVDTGRGSCNLSATKSCDANYGGITYQQKVAACPAPDAIPGTENWTEKNINLMPSGQVQLNAQNCNFNASAPMPYDLIPANFHPYLKLLRPAPTRSGQSQMDTKTSDPVRMKLEPEYSCAAVSVEKRDFAEHARESFTNEEWQRLLASSFNGPVQQLNCTGDDKLRAEALTIGMSPLSFYETTKATVLPNSEYQVDLNQIDSCMNVRADGSLATTNLRSKVPNGPFDEGIIPSQCLIQNQNRCIAIPAGVRQLETGGAGQIDTTEVLRRAQLAAKAFMPNACPDCITVDPNNRLQSDISEEQLNTEPLELEVKVKQPLMVLAGKEVNVSYTASRYWEGKYAAR